MNIYQTEFKPTYLCIKQHTVTGKLYFCKTTNLFEEMISYKGSGLYWKRHIKKHGNHIETIWYCLFIEKEELVKFALMCSEQWNIVTSKDSSGKKIWANAIFENGLDGAPKGIVFTEEHCSNIALSRKGKIDSPEVRENKSKAHIGIKLGLQSEKHIKNRSAALKGNLNGNGNKGKAKSELHKLNLRKPQPIVKCPHCGKDGGVGLMKRYHFENCKYHQ